MDAYPMRSDVEHDTRERCVTSFDDGDVLHDGAKGWFRLLDVVMLAGNNCMTQS